MAEISLTIFLSSLSQTYWRVMLYNSAFLIFAYTKQVAHCLMEFRKGIKVSEFPIDFEKILAVL